MERKSVKLGLIALRKKYITKIKSFFSPSKGLDLKKKSFKFLKNKQTKTFVEKEEKL